MYLHVYVQLNPYSVLAGVATFGVRPQLQWTVSSVLPHIATDHVTVLKVTQPSLTQVGDWVPVVIGPQTTSVKNAMTIPTISILTSSSHTSVTRIQRSQQVRHSETAGVATFGLRGQLQCDRRCHNVYEHLQKSKFLTFLVTGELGTLLSHIATDDVMGSTVSGVTQPRANAVNGIQTTAVKNATTSGELPKILDELGIPRMDFATGSFRDGLEEFNAEVMDAELMDAEFMDAEFVDDEDESIR